MIGKLLRDYTLDWVVSTATRGASAPRWRLSRGHIYLSHRNVAVGGIVSRTHITALREALDQALEVFELPLAPYTDLLDRPTMIKAIHLQQLKERIQ